NNAGIMDKMVAVGDVSNELWQKVMDVNVNGPFWATRRAVNIMMKKGSGNIINISSIGGLRGARAGAAYTTSKHALMGLTKNTAFMYAKKGIRCNAIAPGGVATNMAKDIDMDKLSILATEQILPGMATNPRYGEANEIATTALFLASDDSSFVNGAILVADGGWIAQ
ncbi:MAG: SDR family oxidoreductase, partial [FCB group bacterium]|nr:SDR family oxidoreductase [FCB group bacterium]